MGRLVNKYDHEYSTARIEGFSDAVIAVAITIMVLQIETPQSDSKTLQDIGYFLLTFVIICRFWARHHCVIRSFPEDTPIAGFWLNNLYLAQICLMPFGIELYTEDMPSYSATAVYCGLFSGSIATLGAMSVVAKKPHIDMFLSALVYLTPIPFAKVWGSMSLLMWLLLIPVHIITKIITAQEVDEAPSLRRGGE